MSQGEGQQAIGPVLSGLLQYARTHFAAEERLMQKAGYAAFDAHKKQHDAFIDKVSELETRLRAGDKHLTVDALTFMKNWLVNHIQGQDRQYGPLVMAGAAR